MILIYPASSLIARRQSTLRPSLTISAEATHVSKPISPPFPRKTDPRIIEALSGKDRAYVLKLGELMESLINDQRQHMTISTDTPGQRLLVHRCCAYYQLRTKMDPESRAIHVYITSESHIPTIKLSELIPAENISTAYSSLTPRTLPPEPIGSRQAHGIGVSPGQSPGQTPVFDRTLSDPLPPLQLTTPSNSANDVDLTFQPTIRGDEDFEPLEFVKSNASGVTPLQNRERVLNREALPDQRFSELQEQRMLLKQQKVLEAPGALLDHTPIRLSPKSPHSLPSSRLSVMQTAKDWMTDPQTRLFYLWGPPGVGKTAVIRGIADIGLISGSISSVVFVPHRSCSHSSTCRLLSSISSEFSLQDPSYGIDRDEVMREHPNFFDEDLQTQFDLLISRPFARKMKHPMSELPRLIIIDDLDAYETGPAFLECISRSSTSNKPPPLLWAITSTSKLSASINEATEFRSLVAEIPLEVNPGSQISEDLLLDQLEQIKHLHDLDEPWPSYDVLLFFSDVAAGSIDLASLIVRYLRDPLIGDPQLQLNRLLDILFKAAAANVQEPLPLLDLLYLDVLHRIPLKLYEIVKRILIAQGPLISPSYRVDLAKTCDALDVTEADAYSGLRCLHPVMDIPSPQDIMYKCIRLHADSFLTFLTDSSRSGDYAIAAEALNEGAPQIPPPYIDALQIPLPYVDVLHIPHPSVPGFALPDEETWTSDSLSPRPRDWRADYTPKQGISLHLPEIRRVRSDVEEYIDTVKRNLHPVLHALESEPLTFDLRYQIIEGHTLIYAQDEIDLAQLATSPPAPILRLYHPKLPWYIDIHQSHPTGVTLFDVLAQMSLQMQAPIHNRHYYNDVLDSADRAALGRAYKERCRGRSRESREGILQVDFMGKKYVFEGLARGTQGMWEIRSRLAENLLKR